MPRVPEYAHGKRQTSSNSMRLEKALDAIFLSPNSVATPGQMDKLARFGDLSNPGI